ncbi:30S ribosomal protein S18 [Candidatus Babeliales bacterium]|nr:30S ribosomal protein S18 [Candidatus Babeliales bacterium]
MGNKLRLKVSSRLVKKKNKRFGANTKKQCRLASVDFVDYKDAEMLKNFLTERGKILPSRISGNCAKKQRQLTAAIKLSRTMALIPYCAS